MAERVHEGFDPRAARPDDALVLDVRNASLGFGERVLWSGLNLEVHTGEFVAVLGGNGTGKTSLLRAALGLETLQDGTISVEGHGVRRGSAAIGLVPQRRGHDPLTPMRARDFVRLGIDGHRWGIGRLDREGWTKVDAALAKVGALDLADAPIGKLSGGEFQRVRIAQALVGEPALLLCDEPLVSLDVAAQHEITALIDEYRRATSAAVVFVTHEINPVLAHVDRVLYLAGGRFRVGTVDEVLTSETLSALYGSPIEVVRVGGRIIVAGAPDDAHHDHDHGEDLHGGCGA